MKIAYDVISMATHDHGKNVMRCYHLLGKQIINLMFYFFSI